MIKQAYRDFLWLKRLEKISPEQIRAYLSDRGWSLRLSEARADVAYMEYEDHEVIIALSRRFKDFDQHVYTLIECLSDIYDCYDEEILSGIESYG